MAEAQIKLGYILDPFFQIENTNGKPVVGGHIEVFEAGTDTKYITYQNFDYTQNPFKIPLGSDGRAVVLGDSNLAYDVYIYDSFNNLIVSRLNVAAGDAGGVAGGGLRQVIHDDTMTGRGTQLSPLGVSPLTNLAVDDTMTAYEATVEGKESIVLGVNGDWFNEQFGSAFSGKLDTSSFNSAYYDIKGGLSSKVDWSAMSSYYNKNETYNYFLPRSAIDLTNYYTKDEVYNQNEINTLLDFKQNILDFGYNENSAISSINGSALVGEGGGGSGDCPWISGAKVIGDTITLTDNLVFQVLSSFDLSGYRNHCIGVKGSNFRFPNKWEIASGIAETNYFMPQSGMSGYLPISSFSSYTASIQNSLNSNWDYTNSAYSLSINNFYNKLDASAFSAYTADQGNTYTLVGGDFVSISSDDEAETTTISVTGVPGQGEIDNVVNTISSFSGAWNESTTVVQTNSAAWYDGNTEVNSYVQNNSATINNITNTVEGNSAQWARNDGDSAVNEVVRNFSANGTWLTSHQDLSDYATKQWVEDKGYITGVDLTPYQEKSGMTAYQPVSSMTSYYTTGDAYNLSSFFSGEIGNKLDISSFEAYTANDETYTLIGGKDIGISSDDVNKETTVYFTGANGDEEVNNVVRSYSANGTWLTAHQIIPSAKWENASDVVQTNSGNWNNITGLNGIKNYDLVKLMKYSPTGDTSLGQIRPVDSADNLTFLLHDNLSGVARYGAVELTVTGVPTLDDMTAYQPVSSMTDYVPMSAVSALINVVQTYSAKWLINGDV